MDWKKEFPIFFERTVSIKLKRIDFENSKQTSFGDPVVNKKSERMKSTTKTALKHQRQKPHALLGDKPRVI